MIFIYGDSPVPPETEVTLLPNETRRNHDLAHLEDLALKSAADYFGAELLHWLGIPGKMIRSSPRMKYERWKPFYMLSHLNFLEA